MDKKILDVLNDEADDLTQKEVKEWIDRSPENRLLFSQYRSEWLQIRWAYRNQLIKDKQFDIISQQFQQNKKTKLWRIQTLRIAAAITLFAGASLTWWMFQPQSGAISPQIVQQNSINTSIKESTIVLSDGSLLPLHLNSTHTIEEEGTIISIDQLGNISYEIIGHNISNQLVFNEIRIPRGEMRTIKLTDGSIIWLNSASTLRFPIQFKDDQRQVFLTGEAYMDIAEDKTSPFMVRVKDQLDVIVYGTEFNINTYTPGQIQTVLVSGSAGIRHKDQEILLKPGEKASFYPTSSDLIVQQVDTAPYVAWTRNSLLFQNETLESIMTRIAILYDIEVIYSKEYIKKIILSGDLERYPDINILLNILSKGSSVRFHIENKKVTVYPEIR